MSAFVVHTTAGCQRKKTKSTTQFAAFIIASVLLFAHLSELKLYPQNIPFMDTNVKLMTLGNEIASTEKTKKCNTSKPGEVKICKWNFSDSCLHTIAKRYQNIKDNCSKPTIIKDKNAFLLIFFPTKSRLISLSRLALV